MPVFADRRFQRGHGLGSILGSFIRRLVLPFFKTNAKSMLKNAAKTGVKVASDVIDGRSFSDSVKDRLPTGIKRVVEEIAFQSAPAKRLKLRPRRHRRRRDIFS